MGKFLPKLEPRCGAIMVESPSQRKPAALMTNSGRKTNGTRTARAPFGCMSSLGLCVKEEKHDEGFEGVGATVDVVDIDHDFRDLAQFVGSHQAMSDCEQMPLMRSSST